MPNGSEDRGTERVLIALLCAAAALPFLPALGGAFTNWDDDFLVSENPLLRAGVRDGLLPLLTQPFLKLYAPVSHGVFWLQFQLWGGHPLGYHLVNLLCHVLGAILLYEILRRMLSARRGRGESEGASRAPALLAAAWWAAHPLHVEPVAWVTGLKDVLSILLCLACWRLYLSFREAEEEAEGRRRALRLRAGALAVFALACMAKPSVATLPVILLAGDLWIDGRRGRALLGLIPFVVVALVFMVLAVAVQPAWQTGAGAGLGILDRSRVAADAALFYLGKILWPAGLSPVYGREVGEVLASNWATAKLLAAVALFAGVALVGRAGRLGAVIFLAALAPVSGIVPFEYQSLSTVADRYAGLPMAGAAAILAVALSRVVRDDPSRMKASGHAAVAAMGLWIVLLAAVTWFATETWRDSISLWRRVTALDARPGPRVLNNWTSALLAAGRPKEAIAVAERAVAAAPGDADARYNLGRALQEQGDLPGARQAYRRAIEAAPGSARAWTNLGAVELMLGEYGTAADSSERALQLAPRASPAAMNLGLALLNIPGEYARAAGAFRRVLALRPQDHEARFYLAAALESGGHRIAALAEYRAVAGAPAREFGAALPLRARAAAKVEELGQSRE